MSPWTISELWDRIRRSAAEPYPAFSIPSERILGQKPLENSFKADEAYFELRICEQFLRDRREYWTDYNPLTLVLGDFIYAGQRQSIPFVVGPDLLRGLEQLEGDEAVRYRNTRVIGPTPYRGDDVILFLGLFRVQTRNWARPALALLESVAKVFDPSKLTGYLDVTGVLMDGIESFFGMGDEMQFRLGQRDAFSDPETNQGNVFRPSYFVTIRVDEKDIEKERFWIREDQLYVGDDSSNLSPYREQDYVLYRIAHLEKRNDYTTFDFHRAWEEARDHIWQGSRDKAVESYQHLLALLRRSPDLIPSHVNQLSVLYRAKFQEELKAYEGFLDPTLSVAEIGKEDFSQSLQRISEMGVSEGAIRAIEKSLDFFLESAENITGTSILKSLNEADIQAALDSPTLNAPSVRAADPDALTAALSLETPIS